MEASRQGRRPGPAVAVGCLAAVLLAAVLLPGRRLRAEDRWPDERRAGPFLLHADFSLDGYPQLITEIAQLQQDVSRQLDIGGPREPIHVFLFSHQATYQAYIRHYFPQVPYRRALYIKRRGPGMVFAYRSGELETDVRHECTHALLHAALPMMPLWLDEGLAEYFEVPPDQRPGGNPHLTSIKWHLFWSSVPGIETLEGIEDLTQMGRRQYRDAWAWAHFMLHGPPEAREELRRFLADIRAHTPPGRLSMRLRRRLPDLERRFTEHFRRGSW